MNIFSDIFDWLFNFLSDILEWVIDLLPDSPFNKLDTSVIEPYMGYVNWFIPLDFILSTLTAWLVAVAGYYCWSVVLRWIKAID